MGLFTGTSATSRRPASSAPLKRRSLGRSRDTLSNLVGVTASEPSPNGSSTSSTARIQLGLPQTTSSCSSSDKLTSSHPASHPSPDDEEESEELDLADLQSDNAFLYDRQVPLASALGLSPVHSPQPSLLDRIDAYIAEHYLDYYGVTRQNEVVRHHNRLVPFFAKAPRFLSIHSLKRKELDRDYTDVPDTSETCARKQLCLGRCLLGFACPTTDLADTGDTTVS